MKTQRRIVAREGGGYYVSIPVNYPLDVTVYPKDGKGESHDLNVVINSIPSDSITLDIVTLFNLDVLITQAHATQHKQNNLANFRTVNNCHL